MVVNNVIKKLIDMGFSEYEAKAYIALLKNNPATAYEVAKGSSIPTSKVYEVLARLKDKHVVAVAGDENKIRYIPIAPAEFVESRKTKINHTLDTLRDDLAVLEEEKEVSYVYNIHDYMQLLEKAERMILHAQKTLLLSGWRDELVVLEAALRKREKKGVRISVVHFGEPSIWTGAVFQHPIEDTLYSEKGGRGLTLISDAREALMGTIFKDQRVEGAWSENHGFVTLAEDYIKHDIYIMKIVKRFNAGLIERFGNNYEKLRDVFRDDEVNQ